MIAKLEIDIERLRRFVSALREVTSSSPASMEVDMTSTKHFSECGTPGCHAALAKEALDILGVESSRMPFYSFQEEGDRLGRFLTTGDPLRFDDRNGYENLVEEWARENPELWGNPYGDYLFCDGIAFAQEGDRFPAQVIVDHWVAVLERLEAAE